ncbi:hypothetical protein ACRJZV_004827 [Citrobacter freundii]
MTDTTALTKLRIKLSNPAIGSKDHLRKLSLSLIDELEDSRAQVGRHEDFIREQDQLIRDLKCNLHASMQRTVTVKLPQRLQPGADGYDDWYMHSAEDGEYLKADDVIAVLTAAGIQIIEGGALYGEQ